MSSKKFFYLLTTCMLFTLPFTSCKDDDDDLLTPANAVSGLSFTDEDFDEGKIGGTLRWTLPENEVNIDHYVVYLGEEATAKTTKLGEVEGGTTSFEIPKGTNYRKYLLVVARNASGESTNIASLEVTDQIGEPLAQLRGIYILNRGNWNENNASLSYYDVATGEVQSDLYKTANGSGLGDSAEQLLIYGSKIYITVTTSNRLIVLDKNHKLIKAIEPKNEDKSPAAPRCMVADDGKVYVSYQFGHAVAVLDTTSLEIEKTVALGIGSYPEQLTVSDGKIYVANSGYGTGNTVSVIDQNTFVVEKEIEVVVNPTQITADSQGDVYVLSMGNYGDIGNSLQRIEAKTHAVTELGEGSKMTAVGDNLYVMSYAYGSSDISYKIYDTLIEKTVSEKFITDDTRISNPNHILVDPAGKDIYITDLPAYGNTGTLYIFNPEGKLRKEVDTQGYDPARMVPVMY